MIRSTSRSSPTSSRSREPREDPNADHQRPEANAVAGDDPQAGHVALRRGPAVVTRIGAAHWPGFYARALRPPGRDRPATRPRSLNLSMWDLQPTLIGRRARLEPLAPNHRDDLFEVAGPPEIWDYWSLNPGSSRAGIRRLVRPLHRRRQLMAATRISQRSRRRPGSPSAAPASARRVRTIAGSRSAGPG